MLLTSQQLADNNKRSWTACDWRRSALDKQSVADRSCGHVYVSVMRGQRTRHPHSSRFAKWTLWWIADIGNRQPGGDITFEYATDVARRSCESQNRRRQFIIYK